MSDTDSALCYSEEHRFGVVYQFTLGTNPTFIEGAADRLSRIAALPIGKKIEQVSKLFCHDLRFPKPEESLYDMQLLKEQEGTYFYDLLFLPGFYQPAHQFNVCVKGNRVTAIEMCGYKEFEFSKIDIHAFFRWFGSEINGNPLRMRRAIIDVMKDRMTSASFAEWINSQGYELEA